MATQYLVRLAPVTHTPLIVDAGSLDKGRLKGWLDNQDVEIGLDYFRASSPVDLDVAHKIVKEFAKHHNIPDHDVLIRARLPKTNIKARHTNDANLVLVHDSKQPERRKDDVKAGESDEQLKNAVQLLQDEHDNSKQGAKAATAGNPQGAVVKRTEAEKKPRRKYEKKDKEKSARSRAAYERYVKEISQHIEASPTAMQPAVPGPGVSQEDVDEATLQFALKLAKLLQGVM